MNRKQIEAIIYMEILKTIKLCYGVSEADNPCYDIDLISTKIINKLEEINVLKENK